MFKTKRVWVTFLPRARSELTLNPMIVNVKAKEIVYCRRTTDMCAVAASPDRSGLVVYYPLVFYGRQPWQGRETNVGEYDSPAYEDFFQSLSKRRPRSSDEISYVFKLSPFESEGS